MKAIVLTCDKYRALTEHMIFQYNRLWPDHPFFFRIPYQELLPAKTNQREYVKSPVAIKATVLRLLEDLSDEEWIFWAVDDKYPVAFNLPRIKAITKWVGSITTTDVSGILFCRCRGMLKRKCLTGEEIRDGVGRVYLERKGYDQIWIHQFLRVKVLRYLFEEFPDDIPYSKIMDVLMSRVRLPKSHRLFVSRENLATFGESTLHGTLTQNCYESIVESDLSLPEWFSNTNGRRVIMGRMRKRPSVVERFTGFFPSLSLRLLRNAK